MLKIGQLARASGVSVDTVRFYERRGLLPEPRRLPSGYRVYGEAMVERIGFAKSLQGLGFTLDEIRETLDEVDRGAASCASSEPRFRAVLARIDEKIAKLRTVRRRAVRVLARCEAGRCSLSEQAEKLTWCPGTGD